MDEKKIADMKKEQLKLAKKISLKNDFKEIKLIAGVEQSFVNKKIISAIVVLNYETRKVVEQKYAIIDEKFPYLSGFLIYREGPAITEAYNKLENKPDLLIMEGSGVLHPRKIGLASHIGLLIDKPTIGITKSLLCGDKKESKIVFNGELLGEEVKTKEHGNPIYVSPGHKINLEKSVDIVKNCIKPPHKMPEPLHLAHRYADKLREKIEKEKN
jgi:deoxyribonuclease V